MPPRLRLERARILRLRVTVPADIYSSGIIVEVDGVVAHVKLLEPRPETQPEAPLPNKEERKYGERKQASTRLRSPPLRAPRRRRASQSSDSDEDDDYVPTTQDLAKSFLKEEPQEEKEELEAIVNTQSQRLSDSSSSAAESTFDQELGTGTGLSLPGFLANFLKGIKERLEVRIKNVEFRVELQLPRQEKVNDLSVGPVPASLVLHVKQLAIEGTTTGDSEEGPNVSRPAARSKVGKRHIHLNDICAYLLSEQPHLTKSTKTSQSPSVGSQSQSQSQTSNRGNENKMASGFFSKQSSRSPSEAAKSLMSESAVLERSIDTEVIPEGLETSISTADGERFADPADDEETRTPIGSFPHNSRALSLDASSMHDDNNAVNNGSTVEESQTNDLWKSYVDDDDGEGAASQLLDSNGALEHEIHSNNLQLYQSSDSLPKTPGFMNSSDLISFEKENSEILESESDEALRSSQQLVQSSTILDNDLLGARIRQRSSPSVTSKPPGAEIDDDGGNHAISSGEMSESKIYSHEEAESLYMSAVGAASAQSTQRYHLPGAWDTRSETADDEISEATSTAAKTNAHPTTNIENVSELERCETPTPREHSIENQSHPYSTTVEKNYLASDSHKQASDSPQPLAIETSQAKSTIHTDNIAAKQFLVVKEISLWIPEMEDGQPPSDPNSDRVNFAKQPVDRPIPGTFSEYAEFGTSSRRRSSATNQSSERPFIPSPEGKDQRDEVEISVGITELAGDITTAQLLLEAVSMLISSMRPVEPPKKAKEGKSVTKPSSTLRMRLNVEKTSVFFVESLQTLSRSTLHQGGVHFQSLLRENSSNLLFKCCAQKIRTFVEMGPKSTTVEIGVSHFSFGYSEEDILCFDDSARMRTSVRDLKEPQIDAISASFSSSLENTVIKVGTLPININFDLQKLDDTLISFGGVSGVLELSSSIMSNSTIVPDSPAPKQPRGVHFESPPPDSGSESTPTTKVNVRFGGSLITVRGKSTGLTLQSSALKVLFRPKQGLVGLSIDEIRLFGPHPTNANQDPPMPFQLANTRIEFLFNPNDDDLERLLSLLTPSRDKYENDDDILIDTLLRQRRKGSVIRISIGNVHVDVEDLDSLQAFGKLGDEMAKLSTVTKYLPEDDRPGILTLCAIEELDSKVTVNDTMGTLAVSAQRLQVAHVGLPSLFALEIGTIQAQRNQQEILLRPVLQLPPVEQLPMIMARFLGGEVEPTIKVKLFNVCLEYRVPTIMAILGLQEAVTADEVVADLAASVATVTDTAPKNLSPQSTKSSDHLGHTSKMLHLDVLLRDCALGLNPRNMSSKILVVLTDTKLLSNLPGKENLKSAIEIRKASILITDQEDLTAVPNEPTSRRPGSTGLGSRQITELCKRGYVSVSYMSAAHADLCLVDNADGSKTADIELRDDLFVLETCADSTQTLFATLNGLKPPMPPSRDIKYRTEVMPMEEMMASFTGDAFALGQPKPESPEEPLGLDEGDLLEDEELPTNLEYVGSFYNPDPPPTEEEYGDSMLEEDVDQIASPRPIREIGGQPLLESFQEQYEVGSGDQPLAFEENYFGTGSEVKGHARKWDSVKNQLGITNEFKVRNSPLRVRARDMHIIWHLFDGYDWQRTRDIITKTVKDVEQRAEERRSRRRRSANVEEEDEESVIGDFLFNSIYIGIPANRDPKDLSRQINRNVDDLATETESLATGTTTTATHTTRSPSRGHSTFSRGKRLKVHRSKQHKITFELKGVSMDMLAFPPGSGETQSSIDVKVKEFEIFDHVPTSTWKKFATYLHDAGEREMGKPMVQLQILTVKPVAELAASELVLKVTSISPPKIIKLI